MHMTFTRALPLLVASLLLCCRAAQAQHVADAAAFDLPKTTGTELPQPMQLTWRRQRNARSRRPTLMDIALQESVRAGLAAMSELYGRIQPEMLRNGQLLQDNHPAALLSRFNAPIGDTEQREMAAYATLSATKAFRKNYKHINEIARQSHTQKISLRHTALESLCPPREPPTCMPAAERYRTHDGTCNNKRRPRWGASQMPFNRYLPPEYGDGVDSVRSSTDGSTLSSSRFVSLLVHGAREGEAPLTLMIAQWGQLLDHDMTSTAQPRSINGSIPSCCGGKDFHPSCFPIKVPLDDPWLSPMKVRCLEFLRSAPAQRRDCVLSWREQTNQATSYIDASPIYANSAKASDNARVFRHGLLIYGRGNPAEDVCQRGAIATQCIRAGDGRSGEQPGLLALHHVWVGEHNRIASSLSELNPHWSDEKIYQETRRIVGAMFQHITYREFLPIVLGREVCKLFDLELLHTGYYEGYSTKTNPTVANAFAAAAFRFGHSLVQNSYMRCDRHHNMINNNVSLHEEFQRGDIGSAGSLHRLLRGLASQRALKRDEFITPELTNHLFQTPGFPFGLDLAAINIQRGRDHGIAPYTSWRVPCGLTAIHNWDDFTTVVGPESAKRIGHAYRSVHDIDLFVGGIAERPVVGGLVGPTFACIIAQQFSNSRKGDRFWYENGGFESSFTPAQLHAIRRVSLAQVLCRAVGGGTFQPYIFIPAEFPNNERISCGTDSLAPIDLSSWLEQDPFVTQRPEVVFNVVPAHGPAIHVLKEDKAGFPNRGRPPVHMSTATPAERPSNNLVVGSGIGLQRPPKPTKVSDKLDIRRKTTSGHNRNTTRKPTITGVHNKLDKSPKITLNIKNVNVRKRTQTTTRRTVIINNIPIELRSAVTSDAKENVTEQMHTSHEQQTDLPAPRTAATNKPMDDRDNQTTTGLQINENDITPTDADDIDPMKRTQAVEHKRTQRRLPEKQNLNATVETDNSLHNVTRDNMPAAKQADVKLLLQTLLESHATPDELTTTTNANLPKTKFKTTTKRGLELRSQYQERPIYTRPQKVVLNGPNADEYEIEINIRQTNKNTATRPINDYTTAYKPYGAPQASSYAPHYVEYKTTTPANSYYQLPPSILSNPQQPHRTKPPTVIYLNEYEEQQATTRPPNIFQNLLTFATNGFNHLNNHNNNNNNNNNNNRPSPHSHATSTSTKDKPSYTPVVVNSPLNIGHGGAQSSSASALAHSPHSHNHLGTVHYPVATNAQVGTHPSSGHAHATSSAVSAGNFGTISGVASANGADSIFSFNIRPKPVAYPRPAQNMASNAGGVGYGPQPPRRPTYAPNYVNLPTKTPAHEFYYESEQSPFSSGHSQNRPQNSQNYYIRTSELKEAASDNDILNPTADHKLDINDYDYLSRTLEPPATLANVTSNVHNASTEVDDYDYDDDYQESVDIVKRVEPAEKFSSANISQPELLLEILLKTADANDTKTNVTDLDDDYVLHMLTNNTLNEPTELPRPLVSSTKQAATIYVTDITDATTYQDALPKQINNEISAEPTDEWEMTTEFIAVTKRPASAGVAFAPIKVLTQPDRPDNWVIYETPLSEQSPLPIAPILKMDTLPSAEVPTPIKNTNGLWRKEQLLKNIEEPTESRAEPKLD